MIINEKQLLLGVSYKINDFISIYNPTIGEILDFGEENFYRIIGCLIGSPCDYKVPLNDMGIDYENISDFEFFMIMVKTIKSEESRLVFGDLDLSQLQLAENKETNERVLWNSEKDIVIDEATYSVMMDCIRKIYGIKKQACKPLDQSEKQYLIDRERYEMEMIVGKPYEPRLFPFTSEIKNYRDLRISMVTMFRDSQNCCKQCNENETGCEQQEVS